MPQLASASAGQLQRLVRRRDTLVLAEKEPSLINYAPSFDLRGSPEVVAVIVLRRASMQLEEMHREGSNLCLAFHPAGDVNNEADVRPRAQVLFESAPLGDRHLLVVAVPVDV